MTRLSLFENVIETSSSRYSRYYNRDHIQYDTIGEFNVDSKAECD